jgi:hypothetical protein
VWLRYEEYTQVIPRPYWVHNLEHGAVVFLYRTGAPAATVQTLTTAYRDLPDDPACGHKRAVLVPDPALDVDWAVVAADWMLEGATLDPAAVRAFALAHRNHGPEQVCDQGTRP